MASNDVSYKKVRKKSNKLLKLGLVLILIIGVVLVGVYEFTRTHFTMTTIEGMDCSWLSLEEAKEKLENSISTTQVSLVLNEKNYTATYEELGVEIAADKLKKMQESQELFLQNEFTLENAISANEENVKSFLANIPEFQGDKTEPKDAYIRFDGNNFVIEKEVVGNQLNYNMACEIVSKTLTSLGENQVIDLTSAMELPQLLSSDKNLRDECETLNNVLNTSVTIRLVDGSMYTIDRKEMVNWITYDENDFSFDINTCVEEFVDKLSEAAEDVSTVQIEGTGVGYVSMPIFEMRRPVVMKEETVSFILEKLKNGENYTGKPVYEKEPVTENLTSYIEIDITRQMVYMYLDGECIVETPTVTGNIGGGYYTPTGVFYLNNKVYDTTLRGTNRDGSKYASPVLYWMPFYKGFGMHDANWRSKFGGDIYKTNGSHGCVNLPTSAAKTIYENITYDMPIFIYKSAA